MIVEQTYLYFTGENLVYPYESTLIETDSKRVKYGDGTTAYNDLEYSGFKWVQNHLVVDDSIGVEFIDTIIDGNEIELLDRIIAGNSIIIQDIG